MVFLLLFAGHETTTHLISGAMFELLKNPELRDWLREDWSRLDLAVEEFLRFITPVQFTKPRYVRRDIELGGVRLRKGDKSWRCWPPPTWTRRPIRIPSGSTCSASRTATSPSAPESISVSATSSPVSKADAR